MRPLSVFPRTTAHFPFNLLPRVLFNLPITTSEPGTTSPARDGGTRTTIPHRDANSHDCSLGGRVALGRTEYGLAASVILAGEGLTERLTVGPGCTLEPPTQNNWKLIKSELITSRLSLRSKVGMSPEMESCFPPGDFAKVRFLIL